MSNPPIQRMLHAYLDALTADARLPAPMLERLRVECRVGIRSLLRYRYTDPHELLAGDGGVDILHDVVSDALSGRIGSAKGDVLRSMSRAAYDRFRRGRSARAVQGLELVESTLPNEPSALTRSSTAGTEPDPISMGIESCTDEIDVDVLRRAVSGTFQKRGGGIRIERLADSLGLSRRVLKRRLDAIGSNLGRDDARNEFWLARLAETFVALLQENLEATSSSLVPTAPLRTASLVRAKVLLQRLKFVTFTADVRLAVREARRVVRERSSDPKTLEAIARGLGGDAFSIDLIAAERALAERRLEAAHRRLDDLERAPRNQGAARRDDLLRLARTRCLTAQGRVHEAAEHLEDIASVQRQDPVLGYNRLVLARRTSNATRARQARRDLENLLARDGSVRPLVRHRIRAALARLGS
ncbi:MAG: hypothetical protein H6832_14770 [Planctomycetes bacterium]|nr:hypothetical protein [Planctomycetota bacterium]